MKFYYKFKHSFELPLYLNNFPISSNTNFHTKHTRQLNSFHKIHRKKVFTENLLPYQIISILNYAHERNLPKRFENFVVPNNFGNCKNIDKIKCIPKSTYKTLLDKMDNIGFYGFIKYSKKTVS